MLKDSKYISVFIPTYNGEKYIAECIEAILNQELPDGYRLELLITDSGSTDRTIEIIEAYNDRVIFDQIPNSEFGHGKTRQRAAKKARGEYMLFLSQDATPSHYRWIINMIEPFFISERIGCVFGRQHARPDAAPTIKREVNGVFGAMCSGDSILVHRHKSYVDGKDTNPVNSFFSDVNSAARRELLTGSIPFRDLRYAEDQALSADMQEAGYLKAYAPLGEVWHSNEYTVAEFRKRKFDEYVGLRESVGYELKPSYRSLLLGWIRPTLADWKFIRHDADYRKWLKLKYALLSVGYNYMSTRGRFEAAKFSGTEKERSANSLESSRKSKP